VGKSTYAAHLHKAVNAAVLANDWVCVEREGDCLYASDLNFADSIRHPKRCLLVGVIFLTHKDSYSRDIFLPNTQEYKVLLSETFDTVSKKELDKLSLFWLQHKDKLPFYCAVPTRHKPEAYVAKTLLQAVRRSYRPMEEIEVGIIGVGAVGIELASQLGHLSTVSRVHLFNRTVEKAKGYALDMNHAVLPRRKGDVFVAHNAAEEVFLNASVIFLSFRDESVAPLSELPERWRKLPAHLAVMKKYAEIISATQFQGTIFVITNPVDILTYACYAYTQRHDYSLRTNQVYGVGLELEIARILSYSHHMGISPMANATGIYGNHADDFVLTTVNGNASNALYKAVRGASEQVRQYIPRTVFGPVAAAIRTFQAYSQDSSTYATVLQSNAHMGRKVTFRYGLPALEADPVDERYRQILRNNQQAIADHEHLL